MVGHKKIIFSIDKADKTRDAIRKVIIDFFKNNLGFKDDDIIFVDRSEFDDTPGQWSTKFSDQTKEEMNKFARPIFEDTQFGLANQVLTIAICEC